MHGLKDGDTGAEGREEMAVDKNHSLISTEYQLCGHFELLVCVGVAFPALSVTAPGLNLGAYLPGGASLRDSRIGSASDAFFCNKGSFPWAQWIQKTQTFSLQHTVLQVHHSLSTLL
jgi:hypothetical protein